MTSSVIFDCHFVTHTLCLIATACEVAEPQEVQLEEKEAVFVNPVYGTDEDVQQATSVAAGASTAAATTVATVTTTAATVNYETVYSTIGANKTEELIFDNPIYGASNVGSHTAHTATKQPQTSAMAYDILNLPQYDDPNTLQVLPPAEVGSAQYEVVEVEPAVKDSIPSSPIYTELEDHTYSTIAK